MTLEQALERLDNAEHYIASLRDQIERERRDMRERYEHEIARLRSENERLLRMLAAPGMLARLPPITLQT